MGGKSDDITVIVAETHLKNWLIFLFYQNLSNDNSISENVLTWYWKTLGPYWIWNT